MRANARAFVGQTIRRGSNRTDLITCRTCGQPVDMRDLAAVIHHEIDGHLPLVLREAGRLVRIERQLPNTLARHRQSHSKAMRQTL